MNPLQRAAFLRKVYYLGAVLVLFTVSMFWRGIIPIPLSGTARAAESRTAVQRVADRISGNTILNKARALDLRELEQGDAELEGAFVRLSMLGSRGAAVTVLWYNLMDKQKRNDFHAMETLVQWITRLQPHFLTPWLYQSWNISYNVSVEMQASGDMYHYIARGIDLLAEGERRNNHIYEGHKVGSPDMRYWIGFYYQNKFGVSDQVEVLRCLFQLSCIPPNDRNPDALIDRQTGNVDLARFRDFCQKHPHLVRRLRGEDLDAAKSDELTKKKVQEALKCPMPEHIIQFLRDNREVPSRYKLAQELADADKQFPVLPPKFNESPDEFNPTSDTAENDDFTAYLAARAWFRYSLVPVPPNQLDTYDQPLPCSAPMPAAHPDEVRPGEYDPFRYRIPRQPMLIIFRQYAPRAQTAQAEQEQKEGWFDADGWRIDDPAETNTGKWWFPDPNAPPGTERPLDIVVGTGRAWSQDAWKRAHDMWEVHGHNNGLIVSPERLRRYEDAAQGAPVGLPPDPNDQEMVNLDLRRRYEGKVAMFFYPQNRGVTNFPFFLTSTAAEMSPETVMARKVLWQAEQARKLGRTTKAIDLYEDGLKKWKSVLAKNPNFHRPERSTHPEEETFTYELLYLRLLVQDDARVRARAAELAQQMSQSMRVAGLVLPVQPFPFEAKTPDWARTSNTFVGSALLLGLAAPSLVPDWKMDALESFRWYVAETEFSPFAKNISEADGVTDRDRWGTPWIRSDVKTSVRMNQGVVGKPQPKEPLTLPSGGMTPKTVQATGPGGGGN